MENGFFLTTGTSRGIGQALARKLLEKGNTVLGVSRSRSDTLKCTKYHHLSFDLADTHRISQIMEKVCEIAGNTNFDLVCLVNNASATDPIGSIEKCAATEIEAHVRIGLIAPMILTSMFIREFSHHESRKKVAFISSDPAFFGSPDVSIYESCKAAINMFAECIGLEQKNKANGFEVVSIGPGMVDTFMQEVARSKAASEFAGADFFKQAYLDGELQAPDAVAERIYTILANKYEQGKFVRVSEV